MQGCDLDAANLEGALLLDTDFTDSNWWRARGLSTDTIENLLRTFPPSENIKPAWEDDFKKWLSELSAANQKTNQSNSNPEPKPETNPEP